MIKHYIAEVRTFTTILPTGFLECDGSTPLIANYPALATVLGTTFGGDGITTFGLPDLRGRAPIGVGTGAGLTPRALADSGGAETHQLTDAQLPSHNHTIAVVNNNTSGSTGPAPTRIWGVPSGGAFLLYHPSPTVDSALNPGTVGYNGASPTKSPHQNMQPFTTVRYAIATYTLKTFSLSDGVTASDNKTVNMQIVLNDSTSALDTKTAGMQLSLNDDTSNSDVKTTDAQLLLNDDTAMFDKITSFGFFVDDGTITSDSKTSTIESQFSDSVKVTDNKTTDAQLILNDDVTTSDNKETLMELPLGDSVGVFDSKITNVLIPLNDNVIATDKIVQLAFFLNDGITATDKITAFAFFLNEGVSISDTVLSTELPGNLFEIYSQADNGAVDLIINLVEDDQLPVLVFAILDSDNSPYNLTGATVRLLVRERDALPGDFKINQLMEILPSGFVRYQLQASDTDTPGEYYSEIEISFSGVIMTSQQFLIRIREQL